MSRTRNSAFEDLIEIASFLPWWLAIIFAVLSYIIFHAFSLINVTPTAGSNSFSAIIWIQFFKSFSMLLQFIAPLIFIFGAILSAVRQWKRSSIFNRQNSIETIRNLSWRSFELLISETYRHKGYKVEETQDGPDGGIDLILYKDNKKIFVHSCC